MDGLSYPDESPQSPNPAPGVPDLAYNVYQQLGLDAPNVALQGGTAPFASLKPGDLVGWKGGHQPDGEYVGQMAVYAGNGEIIESAFGQNRRRKIRYNENVFGMPVHMAGDESDAPVGDATMPEQPMMDERPAID